jgi:hypothetical protein
LTDFRPFSKIEVAENGQTVIIINKLYLDDLITGIAKRNGKYINVN